VRATACIGSRASRTAMLRFAPKMELDHPAERTERLSNQFNVDGRRSMIDALRSPMESLSSWWKVAAICTMAGGFAALILLTVKAYQNAPPIPDKSLLTEA
jgi:hypothetical protein